MSENFTSTLKNEIYLCSKIFCKKFNLLNFLHWTFFNISKLTFCLVVLFTIKIDDRTSETIHVYYTNFSHSHIVTYSNLVGVHETVVASGIRPTHQGYNSIPPTAACITIRLRQFPTFPGHFVH